MLMKGDNKHGYNDHVVIKNDPIFDSYSSGRYAVNNLWQ